MECSLNTKVIGILGGISVALVILSFAFEKRPDYQRFIQQDQEYYRAIGTACKSFIEKQPNGDWIPSDMGNDFLPPILADLPVHRITATSSAKIGSKLIIVVGMRNGELAANGYEIIWEAIDSPLNWILKVRTLKTAPQIIYTSE